MGLQNCVKMNSLSIHPLLKILLTVTVIVAEGIVGTSEGRSARDLQRPNKFVNVGHNCTRGFLHVWLETSEPFWGALYARGYPGGYCSRAGLGGTTTELLLKDQTCGMQVKEGKSGEHNIYEVQVYVQFDRWVQQVIDEQVHVQCVLQQPLSRLHVPTQKLKKDIEKFETKQGLKLLKKTSKLDDENQRNASNNKTSHVLQDFEKGVIIQGYNKYANVNSPGFRNNSSTKQSVFSSNVVLYPNNSVMVQVPALQNATTRTRGNFGDVESEIKISSSPHSEEAEAMVSSTLLTVSSLVRERLRNREKFATTNNQENKTVVKKHPKESLVSTTKKEILKHLVTKSNTSEVKNIKVKSGIGSNDYRNKGKMILSDRLADNVNENEDLNEWKPVSDLMDSDTWRNRASGGGEDEPVSVWMDIVKGEGFKGHKASSGLVVGEKATMVVVARSHAGLNTMVAGCSAHDGTGVGQQDLTDARGCAVDDSIMPSLRVVQEEGSDKQTSYASFRAFKFPDRTSLHLRCTVIICVGPCPQSNCKVLMKPRAAARGRQGRKVEGVRGEAVQVPDGELVGVGEFETTDILTREVFGVKQPRGGMGLSVNKSLKSPTDMTEELASSPLLVLEPKENGASSVNSKLGGSSTVARGSFGVIVDKIEVYNSVEVMAPGIESQQQDLVKQYRVQDGDREDGSGEAASVDVFCITPQKLVVAFGILLSVLLAAVLFALYTCARHRLLKTSRVDRQRRLFRHFERSSTSSSPMGNTPLPPASHISKQQSCPPQLPSIIGPGNYYRFHR